MSHLIQRHFSEPFRSIDSKVKTNNSPTWLKNTAATAGIAGLLIAGGVGVFYLQDSSNYRDVQAVNFPKGDSIEVARFVNSEVSPIENVIMLDNDYIQKIGPDNSTIYTGAFGVSNKTTCDTLKGEVQVVKTSQFKKDNPDYNKN